MTPRTIVDVIEALDTDTMLDEAVHEVAPQIANSRQVEDIKMSTEQD